MDPDFWSNILHPEISILEKILRPIIVYVSLIVLLRLAGKRELAQLNNFDLIVLLTISNTVQNAIIGSDNSVAGGLIGATTLVLVNYVVVRFFYRHATLDRLVEGGEDLLIAGGIIREERLRKELITQSELEAAARKQGFASLEEVERAGLEPSGAFWFIGKKPTPDMVRHDELLKKLDAVAGEVQALRLQKS
ncbi:MAG TPA: YetF domain-containing protein [Blastocatellia bacterium]|nr:YetF domain-containing protein [Blastocatellia bacterium]